MEDPDNDFMVETFIGHLLKRPVEDYDKFGAALAATGQKQIATILNEGKIYLIIQLLYA